MGEKEGATEMTDLLKQTPADILAAEASREAAEAFVAYRKKVRKALTERAAKMICKSLQAIRAEGGDSDEALDMAQEHGWQTIKPEWYWRNKNGQSAQGHRNGTSAGKVATNADARTEQISIAARARRTPREDCF